MRSLAGPGGLPDDQPRVDPTRHRRHLLAEQGEEHGDPCRAEGLEVLVDRGERRAEVQALRDVVEAHHTDVLGDPQAAVGQGVDQAEGHLVVPGEDRGQAGDPQQFLGSGVAGFGAPVAARDRWHRQPRPVQDEAPPRLPGAGVEPALGAGEVADHGVSTVEQVSDGEPCALGLVDADPRQPEAVGRVVGPAGERAEQHAGVRQVQRAERLEGPGAGHDHHQALDVLADEELHPLPERLDRAGGHGVGGG
ncbi:hypothetical protein SDC9_153162 [bioreactor metagenome]|uniref:Uncharacterized protein n=1 Tax=bioreactor metagenome TaxID=1076179 RepID=A0A645EV41_9ZZZZ